MASFLDKENAEIVAITYTEIGDHLFEQWHNSNLDEGTFWADYQIALMCDSNYLKGRFNQFYNLTPDEDEYIEWDEEA
jgi:hypothetical protein